MRNYSKIVDILGQERGRFKNRTLNIQSSKIIDFRTVTDAAFSAPNIQLSEELLKKSYDYIREIIGNNKAVYGITTSFGGNIKNIVPSAKAHLLQHNLVASHAANVGTFLPYEFCKAALLIRLITLAKGYSGISPAVAKLMQKMLRQGIVPAIQAHGSMGASGDLGPLSAIAYVIIGQGKVCLPDGKIVATSQAFNKFGLKPLQLQYREGLALINGTAVMTAVASFYLRHIQRLIENSLVIGALSIQAMRASKEPFDSRLHLLKPHHYQINTASVMSNLLEGSKLAQSHQELRADIEELLRGSKDMSKSKIDLQGGSYSLRAIPQIYQPLLALFNLLEVTVNTEINAIDDNPIILPKQRVELHGANFHGHPISVTADALNTAIVTLSNISNSRLDRLLKFYHSDLPSFLATGQEGLYLGLQGVQYTAAGIGAELRGLASPMSINQITTNNDNQDFVSFGLQATLKGVEMTYLLAYVLAVEYIAATQALWLRFTNDGHTPSSLSPLTREAYKKLLSIYTPHKNQDVSFIEVIEKVAGVLLLDHLLPPKQQQTLWK